MAKKPTAVILPQEPVEPQKPLYEWPASEEKRNLFVILDSTEMSRISRALAETVPAIATLQRDAKVSANQWKGRIELKESEQAQLSWIVQEGKEERSVPCEWVYECSGVDSDSGERIYHPEKKALFRSDTGEFIETREITSDERQMSLIDAEPPAEEEVKF